MEALSSLINKAMSGGFFSNCRVKRRGGIGTVITYLLFVDDTLFFL